MGANEITLLVVVEIECTFAGIENRLSDAARQVNVSRRDNSRIRFIVDGYDPMKRVFISFGLLRVTCDIEDLVPMRCEKAAAQVQFTGGIFVVDAVTSLAQVFIGRVRLLTHPLPAPLCPDSTTLPTDGRFLQFEACLIGIVDPFANEAVLAFRLLAQRCRARLLHLYTPYLEYDDTCRPIVDPSRIVMADRDCGTDGNVRRIPDTCLSADCRTDTGLDTIQHADRNNGTAGWNRTTKGVRTTTRGNSVDAVFSDVYNGGRAGGDRTYGGVGPWDVRDDACACNAGACEQLFELVTYS